MSTIRRQRRTVSWQGARPGPGEYLRLVPAGVLWRIADVARLSDGRLALDLRRHNGEMPVGSVRHSHLRVAHVDPVGPAVVRQVARGPNAVMSGDWRDPIDNGTGAKPRQVHGWRVFCVLRRAIANGATNVTHEHVAAADYLRLRIDQARHGLSPSVDIGSSGIGVAPGPRGGPSALCVAAAHAAGEADGFLHTLSFADRAFLLRVLLENLTVSRWCRAHSPALDARREMGRLVRLLDQLALHFADKIKGTG